jgi:hypothetical protein
MMSCFGFAADGIGFETSTEPTVHHTKPPSPPAAPVTLVLKGGRRTKIQALCKLEAAVTLGDAKQRAR